MGKYNPNWCQKFLNHLYKKLIPGGSGCGKTNVLLNLKKQQGDESC